MLGINRILVAIDRSEEAAGVMEKAMQLARAANAEVEVVRVIYEGIVDLSIREVEENQAMKTFVMQSEEAYLEDLVEPFRTRTPSIICLTLWNKNTWEGILDAAEDFSADLIIKASNPGPGFGRTPSDWHLLRHATVPVMIVKGRAWQDNLDLFAAIDAIDETQRPLNISVLQKAHKLARILNGQLHILAAYPITEPFTGPFPDEDTDFSDVRNQVEQMVRKNADDMVTEAGIDYQYLYVIEGPPAMAIKQLMDDTDAELLVMGTVARSGLKGFVIGNTSETILHHTDCDVAVIR
ncbi:MAG: universal stress protein [Proteobacteria bacterium]|jgi:universal stress protein E|nr:universal stress protein [Pseudomonadota bacterium]MDA1299525.1 universal stress protein [Pseudomonadota bacterium]